MGACTPHPNLTDPEARCSGTFCDGMGACITPCPNDSVCKSGYYCESALARATCVLQKSTGSPCVRPAECVTNQCVDGVC